jgi:hypothetical protein
LIQNTNIMCLMGSGSFPLKLNQRERYSMALVFGENLDDLILNKNIAQAFYNNNYRLPDSLTSLDENQVENSPKNFGLEQNYPNPFNPLTKISYAIASDGIVILTVFDVLGNTVAELENGYKLAGSYTCNYDASKLTSGVYYYRLQVGEFVQTKKMILIK